MRLSIPGAVWLILVFDLVWLDGEPSASAVGVAIPRDDCFASSPDLGLIATFKSGVFDVFDFVLLPFHFVHAPTLRT